MKALINEQGKLHLRDVPLAPLGEAEARVRVKAAGICATDLHVLSGRITFGKSPRILGHEVAGIVEEVGSVVAPELIGQRVIVDPVIGCGDCAYCRAGRKLLCANGGELGTTGGDGAYAEYTTVPAENLYLLPDWLSFEEGSLMEPLNCTLGAFQRALPQPGESVLIFGSGPAGLLFTELARMKECKPILLIGGDALRLDAGKKVGADEAWDYRDKDLAERVRAATNGDGPDIVVEASGTDIAVRQGFEWVRRGGRVVLYGISGTGTANIPSDLIVGKDLYVVTGIGSPLLWDETIRVAAMGRIKLEPIISHRFPLEDFEQALAVAADAAQSIKVILTP